MEGRIPTDLNGTTAQGALDVIVVLLAVVGVALLIAAWRLIRARLHVARQDNRELPPLVYPARRVDDPLPRPVEVPGPGGEVVRYNSSAPPNVHLMRDGAERGQDVSGSGRGSASDSAAGRLRSGTESGPVEGTGDNTLQLLPGRLEPVDHRTHQEIRFVRVPGENRFTLGRNAAQSHSHIQLRAATASRMHAYMLFDDGRWQVGNMSDTNAVVVNGAPLNGGAPTELKDGDRLEFGELSFVFRER